MLIIFTNNRTYIRGGLRSVPLPIYHGALGVLFIHLANLRKTSSCPSLYTGDFKSVDDGSYDSNLRFKTRVNDTPSYHCYSRYVLRLFFVERSVLRQSKKQISK
jgi:hypothetical protein